MGFNVAWIWGPWRYHRIAYAVLVSVDDELVELLIVAEAAASLELVTQRAHAMGEAILACAEDTVDVSTVLGRKQAMLSRVTRRDFDAAVDALTPILVALRQVQGVRIEMEVKHYRDLALKPITRHLV